MPRALLDRHVASLLAMMMWTASKEAATARKCRCNTLKWLDSGSENDSRRRAAETAESSRATPCQSPREGDPGQRSSTLPLDRHAAIARRKTGVVRRPSAARDDGDGRCTRPEIPLQRFEKARFTPGNGSLRRLRYSHSIVPGGLLVTS